MALAAWHSLNRKGEITVIIANAEHTLHVMITEQGETGGRVADATAQGDRSADAPVPAETNRGSS